MCRAIEVGSLSEEIIAMTNKQLKTRNELSKWSGAELFAYAVANGFSNQSITGRNPNPALCYCVCYGCGYSDEKYWTIPYTRDENCLPVFDEKSKETLIMILAGEHLITWNKWQEAKANESAARKAHENFMNGKNSD